MGMGILEIKDNFKKINHSKSILKTPRERILKYDLTVCIPTYNRPKLLKEAILSCLHQQESPLKVLIIVVDNCQELNNENEKIVCNINDKYNSNILYYQNSDNLGMFGNWNRCIELAKSDWISILHDDDLLVPDCYQKWNKLLQILRDSKDAYMKSYCIPFKDITEIQNKNFKHKKHSVKLIKLSKTDFLYSTNIGIFGMPTAGVLLRRQAFIDIGGYNDEFYPSDDAFISYRLFANGYNAFYTPTPLGYYRYAVNTSYRLETQIGWMSNLLEYQKCLKMQGILEKKFVEYFGIAEVTVFFERFLSKMASTEENRKIILSYIEKNVKGYQKRIIRVFIYRCLKKIHFLKYS